MADELSFSVGSSPRVRGKRIHGDSLHLVTGLIPACAGKTSFEPPTYSQPRAHPRVCGENSTYEYATACQLGSSPRVRGKRCDCPGEGLGLGLIPACAGKTRGRSPRVSPSRAHPRVCGENPSLSSAERQDSGSSPRVRGKRFTRPHYFFKSRLIPACAGKTLGPQRGLIGGWAHPRVCGENGFTDSRGDLQAGSSPRVRGKHAPALAYAHPLGLIPACAGKTFASHSRRCRHQAHPRVCGENFQ